jgi:hypothetical protein
MKYLHELSIGSQMMVKSLEILYSHLLYGQRKEMAGTQRDVHRVPSTMAVMVVIVTVMNDYFNF